MKKKPFILLFARDTTAWTSSKARICLHYMHFGVGKGSKFNFLWPIF